MQAGVVFFIKSSKDLSDDGKFEIPFSQTFLHHATKQANPTAAAMTSALARTIAPELAFGPQHARL
jgi:hypothetical protein